MSSAHWDVHADRIRLLGDWTLPRLHEIESLDADAVPGQGPVCFDASELRTLDTSGAFVLLRLVRELDARERTVRVVGLSDDSRALLEMVDERGQWTLEAPPRTPPLVERIGRGSIGGLWALERFVSFTGAVAIAVARSLLQPRRFRVKALFHTIQSAGVDALPIVGLMAFLLGVVIAYQGGIQLRTYGANIFIVELVCLTMVRELAPLIAAIMVAGRTGSAFTAQIGTMRVTEEVDALRTIGIDPFDMLVVPKLIALMIALPLLTVFADVLSVFGGMVIAQQMLDVSFSDFIDRIPLAVTPTSFLIGLAKAPVFAAIIALIGCYQGFQVTASAESVGRQTTASVVQAIFLVIVADAAFSVALGTVGL